VTGAPVIEYRRSFALGAPPETVWAMIERTGEFDSWWGWLRDFHVEGTGLRVGSVLVGVVSPPLPYHMLVRVELGRCVRPSSIEAAVHGDLEGDARLDLVPRGSGTVASVAWTIEMVPRSMRAAARVAYPVLCWGHDRVVEATVHGFRRRLAAMDPGPGEGAAGCER
jgi:carbon monoxide dehydrogenase subunit G